MLIGAHVSVGGGIANAPANAAEIGCEVFQIFSRSPQGGPAPALTKDVVASFRNACDEYEQREWYIHTPYYINLASVRTAVCKASIRVIREELERGTAIGATAVITHMGSAKDVGEERGLAMTIAGIQEILQDYKGTTQLLAEISAGAGAVIGDTFEDLAAIVQATQGKCQVCYDTQHAFASGYDLRTAAALSETLDAFDHSIGLEHLRLSHCNDSMVPFGSHKDRHEHIGKGEIGTAGFQAFFREPRLANMNVVLETKHDAVREDIATLKQLRKKQ